MSDLQVRHNRDEAQFEADVEGGLAVVAYNERDGEIIFHHTEVPVASEGKGVAQALVRTALQYARDQQLAVVAECAYVAAFVRKHREYDDILAEAP